MSNKKTNWHELTATPQQRIKRARAKYPDAYALTVNEAIRVQRFDSLIWRFFDAHREFVATEWHEWDTEKKYPIYRNLYNDESIALLKDFFAVKRLSLANAHALANRVLSHPWFELVGIFSANPTVREVYLNTSDDERHGRLSLEEWAEFYAIWDIQDDSNALPLREALKLDSSYLYLVPGERDILRLIKIIYEYDSSPFSTVQEEGFVAIKSTPQTTDLVTIGKPSLSKAGNAYDELNELFTIVSPAEHRLYLNNSKLLSGWEFEKLDRLLRQINSKAMEMNYRSKSVDISLDEYMELRGLSDRKEARLQYKRDTFNLFMLYAEFTDGSRTRQVRFLQERGEVQNSNVTFILSDAVFESMRLSGSMAMIPKSFFKLKGNAYRIAIYLCDNKKRNINRDNENRVSIAKLLEVTTLPIASEVEPKRYKSHIIDAFFNALSNVVATGEITYEVVKSKGAKLSSVEAFTVHHDYELFSSCLIDVHWSKEPEYYKSLREHKAKDAEAQERGRVKGIEDKARRKARGK